MIYQTLNDDDQISVKKTEEGTIEVSDGETGAEIVVELTPGDGSAEEGKPEVGAEETEESPEKPAEEEVHEDEPEEDEEIEIDLSDELNEELGYTDDYQDKDVIDGLKMDEPSDEKATYSMDGGVPKGVEKPWAGKHEEKDYTETHTDLAEGCKEGCVNEAELDESQTTSKSQRRHAVKTLAPNSGETDKPEVSKEVSIAGQLSEAKAAKILEAAKRIQAENKKIKAIATQLNNSLKEAATLNVNYGKIVNLLVNETTTKEEKVSILERFSNVKTINEGQILYESIKRELNESNKKNAVNVLSEQISAESSKTINETPIHQTSVNNPSLALMERMEKLSNYNNKGGFKQVNATNASLDLMNRMGR